MGVKRPRRGDEITLGRAGSSSAAGRCSAGRSYLQPLAKCVARAAAPRRVFRGRARGVALLRRGSALTAGKKFDIISKNSKHPRHAVFGSETAIQYAQECVHMITAKLKEMRDERKLTNKDLSQISGVPLSTVNRIMSGRTDTPYFQNVYDLVRAMGGSLDQLTGIAAAPEIREEAAAPQNAAEPINQETLQMYKDIIADKDQQLSSNQKWMYRLFVCCTLLMTVIVVVCIIDVINPSIGFLRR